VRLPCAAVLTLALAGGGGCDAGKSTKFEIAVESGSEERSYTLFCHPHGGSHPEADAACLTLDRHHEVMLNDPHPGQTCIGGIGTVHIRVTRTFRGERVSAQPDACSGKVEGERLWLKDLPALPRPFGR
jgi:hypothetical protein